MSRWWSNDTIAVVTGSNRGIGFEIARQLAVHGLTVILTSRDEAVGQEAAKILQEGGLNVVYRQLDVVDHASILLFTDWLRQNYGGADVLVQSHYSIAISLMSLIFSQYFFIIFPFCSCLIVWP